jgi:uncharacterized protein (TIGR02448 family)
MKSPAVLLAIALLTAAPAALASSFAGTSAGGSSASSASSDSSSGNDKVVLAAHDDAASFVASDGAIRGAQLEAALRHLREHAPQAAQASDIELAKAILAL